MGLLLETVMLICFGVSWPINLIKAYRSHTAKSTSVFFLCLIIIGYVAGISAKIITGQINYVFAIYWIDLALVLANLAIYFRNRAQDRIHCV